MSARLSAVPTGSSVSPCCCPPPAPCCLYPFPDPSDNGGPFYRCEDLPDSIEFVIDADAPVVMTRVDGEYHYTGAGSSDITAELDGSYYWNWSLNHGAILGLSSCLIGIQNEPDHTLYFYDQFAGLLYFSINGIEYTLTRESLCYWKVSAEGHNAAGPEGIYGLYYEAFTPYSKNTTVQPYNLCWVLNFVDPDENYFEMVKDDPQNAPDGTYGSEFLTVTQ